MKKLRIGSTVLLFGFFVILMSCLEELEKTDRVAKTTFRPAIEFPLINSEFSMRDFLTKGESKAMITEQDGVMVITYDDSISTPLGDSFFFLPDQQSPTLSITGPEVSFPSPGGSVTVTKEATFDFNASNGEVLDSILMKAGEMLFQMNSTFRADISITIDIPSLKISGSGFQQVFTFNGPGVQNPSFDLASATLDLVNGGTTNSVSFSVTAVITDTGQPIDNSHSLEFGFALNGLQFRGMFGDLGSPAISFSADSIDVDVFDNAFDGTVELLAPAVYLTMKNSFGIPIGFDIESISGTKSSVVTELDGAAVSSPANPYRLDAPSYDQIGESISSQIALTPANSNLPALISSLPEYLSYRLGLELNPAPVSSKNFVLDDSNLTIGIHLELPLYGRISGLSITKQFDFGGLGIDDVEQSFIRLKTVNELPIDVDLQVYFSDADGTVLDSLFSDPSVIQGAQVDSDGFTQSSAELVSDVSVTQAKVDRIEQAELLILKATMSTTNAGGVPVKFSADDKIRMSLGVHTRVSYDLN